MGIWSPGAREPGEEEIGRKELCPCGSGRRYGRCCRRKAFSFKRTIDGGLVKTIKLGPEVYESIRELTEERERMYGRPSKPDDLVFSGIVNPATSMGRPVMNAMRRSGISEDVVYAYFMTEGLLPTEGHLDAVSDADLAEFTHYRNEFERLVEDQSNESSWNAVKFTLRANQYIGGVTYDALRQVSMVLSDFIARHATSADFSEFALTTELDYGLFSAQKAFKTLESVTKLCEFDMPEAVYALTRGLFENHLYLQAVASDVAFFRDRVAPRADDANYRFVTKSGKINYNRVEHVTTGVESSTYVRLESLLKYSATSFDQDLFDLFYQSACQFVHADVLSARAYFHQSDPFDEVDRSLVSGLVAATLAGLVLGGIAALPGVEDQFQLDAEHFLSTLSHPISMSFQLLASDPDHQNAVYPAFGNVADSWSVRKQD